MVLSTLQEDGTTVLRLIFGTSKVRNPSWNLVCGLSEMNTVSFMLCAWFTSMISCWRAVTLLFGKHVFESIHNLYEWRKWESREFNQCGAQITQAYNKHAGTWWISDQLHRIRKRDFDHHFAITSTPRQEIQNHTT